MHFTYVLIFHQDMTSHTHLLLMKTNKQLYLACRILTLKQNQVHFAFVPFIIDLQLNTACTQQCADLIGVI